MAIVESKQDSFSSYVGMPDTYIIDPITKEPARVFDGKVQMSGFFETSSAMASKKGLLFGISTHYLKIPLGFKGFVLWWKHDNSDYDFRIKKFIAGWSEDKNILQMIWYKTNEPTDNFEPAGMGNDNLRSNITPKDMEMTAFKVKNPRSGGMKMDGGFEAIPNQIHDKQEPIMVDNEIVIPSGTTQAFHITNLGDNGIFNLSVVGVFEKKSGDI